MAIKIIAQRREVKLGKNPGKKFVMRPDLYIPIQEKKVFSEASTHSGISAGVIKAAWDAAGEVIRTWATEGHSIPLPGLGTMRFGVRSKIRRTTPLLTPPRGRVVTPAPTLVVTTLVITGTITGTGTTVVTQRESGATIEVAPLYSLPLEKRQKSPARTIFVCCGTLS